MLHIRHILQEDLKALKELVATNKERLRTSFPITVKQFDTAEGARNFVNNRVSQALTKSGYYFLIFLPTLEKPIGVLSIKEIDWNIPKAELAYYVDKDFEGKGIVTEALQWLVRYAFEELKLAKVYVRVHLDNEGSKRVAVKNGFALEGILKNDSRNGAGKLCDVEYYGLINEKR